MSKQLIGGVVAAAAIVVAILVGIQVFGGDDTPTTASQFQGVEEVATLVKGIPQQGAVLGDANAPVTITEFADLQCSACAAASTGVIRELITKYARTGKVRMKVRLVQIIGPDSERGALAGEAASLQSKGWQFSELILTNQGPENGGWLTDGFVEAAAEGAGLDVERWKKDFAGDAVVNTFFANTTAFQATAGSNGLSTPTFVIEGPGEKSVIQGVADISQFDAAIVKARGAN